MITADEVLQSIVFSSTIYRSTAPPLSRFTCTNSNSPSLVTSQPHLMAWSEREQKAVFVGTCHNDNRYGAGVTSVSCSSYGSVTYGYDLLSSQPILELSYFPR